MGGREGWGWGLLPLIQDGEGALGLLGQVCEGLTGGHAAPACSQLAPPTSRPLRPRPPACLALNHLLLPSLTVSLFPPLPSLPALPTFPWCPQLRPLFPPWAILVSSPGPSSL